MVATDVTGRLAACFGLAMDGCRRLTSGNSSDSWAVEAGGREYVLRIASEDTDGSMLELRMDLAGRLGLLGAPMAEVVASPAGRLVERVMVDGRERLATALVRAAGVTHDRLRTDSVDGSLFEAVGSSLAALHGASLRLGDAAAALPAWEIEDNCFNLVDPEPYAAAYPDVMAVYQERRAACLGLPRTPGTYGLIHADIHFDNIVVAPGGGIRFCDFDDLCRGWFAMDLAMVVFDLAVVLEGPDRDAALAHHIAATLEAYNRGAAAAGGPDRLDLDALRPFIALLEAAVYLQCAEFMDGAGEGTWVQRFCDGRGERILSGRDYLDGLHIPRMA